MTLTDKLSNVVSQDTPGKAYARWGGAKIFTNEAYDEDRAGRTTGAVA